ncbi:MAG: 2-amino-4-hydroxy-6-hydroxymethyldihydropteridine diphosphokinase, partial [Candidatus Peregrinibacteria bacterium]
MKKVNAYLSLGGNVGRRQDYLEAALKLLSEHPAIDIAQVSPIYETEPWGKKDQPWFLNQVLKIQTELPPEKLLKLCESVEQKLKRIPTEIWGPREIDVDILLYGDEIINSPDLRVPHPHMNERRFILVPLVEIAP